MVGLVLVSHVAGIAEGIAGLIAQMAPEVPVVAAGGTDDGGIGTSFDRVLAALEVAEQGAGVIVLYDLGSALLTAESAVELLDDSGGVAFGSRTLPWWRAPSRRRWRHRAAARSTMSRGLLRRRAGRVGLLENPRQRHWMNCPLDRPPRATSAW